jgi:hypothetical protein
MTVAELIALLEIQDPASKVIIDLTAMEDYEALADITGIDYDDSVGYVYITVE